MAPSGKNSFVMVAILLCCLYGAPALGADTTVTNDQHITELWEGKALTARFRVGICYQKKGRAMGVLLLRHANGQEDVYHLYGTLENNEFNLSHSSGHHLSGKLTGADSMQGKAKLKNGLSFSLSGKRYVNVPLIASDCAPLPQ